MQQLSEAEREELQQWYEHALSSDAAPSHFMFSNESYLKSFWQNANHGIMILNQDYEIVDANPYICEILKTTKAEITTKHVSDILAEQFIQQDYINISSVVHGKQYSFKKDTQLKEKYTDNTLIPVRVVATRVPSALDEPFKYVIVHIYPQTNVILTYKNAADEPNQGLRSQSLTILKSVVESKWFRLGSHFNYLPYCHYGQSWRDSTQFLKGISLKYKNHNFQLETI